MNFICQVYPWTFAIVQEVVDSDYFIKQCKTKIVDISKHYCKETEMQNKLEEEFQLHPTKFKAPL